MDYYDLVVIGGGINGAAIAADAAGRGLKVFLCEKNDFASGTSSASSKLIHGGLRYLELYEFHLVREALRERSILLKRAPNLVSPLTFVMPDLNSYRSPWLIRLGLFLYDKFAGDKKLAKSKRISLSDLAQPTHLKQPGKGFTYSDCWGDDARLVIANLLLAKEKGAVLAPRVEFLHAIPEQTYWRVDLRDEKQAQRTIYAKALVNATGPWVANIDPFILPEHQAKKTLKLVKGSHIVVKKFYAGKEAFILQNEDGRIVFLIPFQEDKLIIGTTDVPYAGDPAKVKIDAQEVLYLIKIIQKYFEVTLTTADILWHYSGVRPLYDNHAKTAAKLTRDFHLELDEKNHLPLITLYGGKLTTHRCLAEQVLKKLQPYFPAMQPSWTAEASFPGCDFRAGYAAYIAQLRTEYAWLPEALLLRWVALYGTLSQRLLSNSQNMAALGQCFGGDLYELEVRYLVEQEWAKTAQDILWRRTKLGLSFKQEQIEQLNAWLRRVYPL